jgi:hypothetical protein
MKNILIPVMILLCSVAHCQIQSNIISKNDFNEIKINGVTLKNIRASEGKESLVKNLYNHAILEKDINHGERGPSNYWYKYNGFEFAFTDSAGSPNHPGLSSFKITRSNWSITILENTIKIGDNISQLGTVVFNTRSNGTKSIIYQFCDGCNSFIYIHFDQSTNIITRIGFVEPI